MAITANMTTHDGIALTNAYCYIPTAYVKKFNGEWSLKTPQEMNEDGSVKTEAVYEQGDATWKLIYDVLIYADADKRADRQEKTYRIKNNHVDHHKCDYDLNATDNPFKLAYADLKTNSQLSNVKDVTE
jgi:hypothetical protein|tara:strand:- start:57 stop:443 length:387 start_codon:yes stop_codon:yes gene_type:complete